MKAAVVEKPGKLVVKEVETPTISEEEVLLKVITASICNATDNHILHGIFEGYHDFYPQILGHEVFGKVIEVGDKVEEIEKNDRLVLYTPHGAFCEYVAVNPEKDAYAKVPQSIPDREASLCEMLHGSYLGMVYPAQLKKTEDVLIIGQGPMGLTAAAMSALEAKTVSTVDLYQFRLNKSLEMGSDYIYNRSRMSAAEISDKIQEELGGVDVVFMCIAEDRSEEKDAFNMGIDALKKGGRMSGLVVDVKNIEENHRIDPHRLIKKNIKFKSILEDVYKEKDMGEVFQEAVNTVAAEVDLGKLITHEVNLDELEYALDLCENKLDQVIKVVVYPE